MHPRKIPENLYRSLLPIEVDENRLLENIYLNKKGFLHLKKGKIGQRYAANFVVDLKNGRLLGVCSPSYSVKDFQDGNPKFPIGVIKQYAEIFNVEDRVLAPEHVQGVVHARTTEAHKKDIDLLKNEFKKEGQPFIVIGLSWYKMIKLIVTGRSGQNSSLHEPNDLAKYILYLEDKALPQSRPDYTQYSEISRTLPQKWIEKITQAIAHALQQTEKEEKLETKGEDNFIRCSPSALDRPQISNYEINNNLYETMWEKERAKTHDKMAEKLNYTIFRLASFPAQIFIDASEPQQPNHTIISEIFTTAEKYGLVLNCRNHYAAGSTALIEAAKNNDMETIAILLRHGANLKAVDGTGRNAFYYAALYGHKELCDYLKSQPGLTPQEMEVMTETEKIIEKDKRKIKEAEQKHHHLKTTSELTVTIKNTNASNLLECFRLRSFILKNMHILTTLSLLELKAIFKIVLFVAIEKLELYGRFDYDSIDLELLKRIAILVGLNGEIPNKALCNETFNEHEALYGKTLYADKGQIYAVISKANQDEDLIRADVIARLKESKDEKLHAVLEHLIKTAKDKKNISAKFYQFYHEFIKTPDSINYMGCMLAFYVYKDLNKCLPLVLDLKENKLIQTSFYTSVLPNLSKNALVLLTDENRDKLDATILELLNKTNPNISFEFLIFLQQFHLMKSFNAIIQTNFNILERDKQTDNVKSIIVLTNNAVLLEGMLDSLKDSTKFKANLSDCLKYCINRNMIEGNASYLKVIKVFLRRGVRLLETFATEDAFKTYLLDMIKDNNPSFESHISAISELTAVIYPYHRQSATLTTTSTHFSSSAVSIERSTVLDATTPSAKNKRG